MTLPHQALNVKGLEMVELYLRKTNNYSELHCHSFIYLQIANERQNMR